MMTYLGRVNTTKASITREEETFPISELRYTVGKLLNRTECQTLLDTVAIISFVSKSH